MRHRKHGSSTIAHSGSHGPRAEGEKGGVVLLLVLLVA